MSGAVSADAGPPGSQDRTLPEYPRLADSVSVSGSVSIAESTNTHAPWVVQRGSTYYRVGADAALLLRSLDGRRTCQELAELLGAPWTTAAVRTALHGFAERDLLHGRETRPVPKTPWVRFVPPFTVQFTVVRPARVLTALRPLFVLLANRLTATLALGVAAGGLVTLVVQGSALHQALSTPLPLWVYLWVLVAFLASTVIHEMGHAVVLVRYGGMPSRIGVMLFYLTPAFFCDVSDGWRLGRRERVRVALAGVATQSVVAGVVSLVALTVPHPDVRHGVLVFAVVAYAAGVVNLLPFVKLDGYIALMSRLDLPFLRDRAMTDARRFLARVLFGGRGYAREVPRPWSVPYGLACLGFPLYLLVTAAALWLDLLQRSGIVGASLVVCAGGYLGYYAVRGVGRAVGEARTAGAPRWRVTVVVAALGAAASACLLVPVPHTMTGGYVQDGQSYQVVFPATADHDPVSAGQPVELARAGVVTNTPLGRGEVTSGSGAETTAPVSAFVPVVLDPDPGMPVVGYPIAADQPPPEDTGVARVTVGGLPAWEFAYRGYLAPLLTW